MMQLQNNHHHHSRRGGFIAITMILLIWHLVSFRYHTVILPGPVETFRELFRHLMDRGFYQALLVSCIRLLISLGISLALGLVFGLLMGIFKPVNAFLSPIIYLFQSIPPIIYMTLAMIWFGLSGTATIFIVTVVSFPVLAVNICEGFSEIDEKLIEMGRTFGFDNRKILLQVIIPSLISYLKSGLIIMLGLSWKLLIMGEVLSAGTGIGSLLTEARMNLETEKVFALGLIVVFFCILTQHCAGRMVSPHDR